MGIVGVEKFMGSNPGCNRKVRIQDLKNSDKRNVVVVDGNLFYEIYLFPKFNWICCNIIELLEEIRIFVRSFEKLGMSLVFFFSDGTEKDEMRRRWTIRRTSNVIFAMNTLAQGNTMQQVLGKSGFPNRPIQFKCSIISALLELNCEVRCCMKDRVSEVVSYVRLHDCLAVLSQDSFYVFCDIQCRYLSLKYLKLWKMETIEYDRTKFALCLGLNKDFLPLFAAITGDNKNKEDRKSKMIKERLFSIIDSNTSDHYELVAAFINKYLTDVLPEELPHILTRYFDRNAELILSLYNWLKNKCLIETNELYNNEPDINNLSNWERIKYRSIQLLQEGNLCSKICSILNDRCYEEHVILEDFQDFPANGLVYRPIRKRMYGLLLQDAPDFGERIGVNEWCMQNGECPANSTTVFAEVMNGVPLISLLTIWDVDNVRDYNDEKWQLFACCISPALDFRAIQELPSHLVIPSTLLFYLYYEVPRNFDRSSYQLFMEWEIEVFIAVAVTLQDTSLKRICSVNIENLSVRAVKLIAIFLSGCHTVHMVADICKCIIDNQNLLSVWHFFDGKLFLHLYEKASKQQINWKSYCGPEWYGTFLQIRNIVLPIQHNDKNYE